MWYAIYTYPCSDTHYISLERVVLCVHNKSRQKWVRGLFINFSHRGNKSWCKLVINIPYINNEKYRVKRHRSRNIDLFFIIYWAYRCRIVWLCTLFMNTNDMKRLIELCSCLMSLHLSWITIETLKMNHVRGKQCVFSDRNLHLFHTCLHFWRFFFKLNLLFPFLIHNGTIGIWQLKVQYPSYIILLCLWWEIQGRSIYDRLVIVYETSGQSNPHILISQANNIRINVRDESPW